MSCDGKNIHWDMIRLAMGSVARYAIFPLQDILGLDSNYRMNTPGTSKNNWAWRFKEGDIEEWMSSYLKDLSKVFWRNQIAELPKEETEEDSEAVPADEAGKNAVLADANSVETQEVDKA